MRSMVLLLCHIESSCIRGGLWVKIGFLFALLDNLSIMSSTDAVGWFFSLLFFFDVLLPMP